MYAGQHGDYLWELVDGELVISSPRVGEIKRQAANNRFNNAEQATWFAQGQIDMHGDELNAALDAHKKNN